MLQRILVSAAVFGVCTTAAWAQEASLWSYTGNDVGAQGFQIRQFAVTPDATRAVTFAQQFGVDAPQQGKFAVWDFATGKQVAAWRGERMSVSLAISRDGAKVASLGLPVGGDGPVKIDAWQVADGKHLAPSEVRPQTDAVRSRIRFSEDGRGVFLLGGFVQRLEIGSGQVADVGSKPPFPAEDIDWPDAGDRLAWLNPDKMFLFAPAEDYVRGRRPARTIGMPHQATDARLSGDGKTVFVSLTPNVGVRAGFQFLGVWDAASGEQLQLYDCQWRELEFLRNLHVSHDGQFAAGTRGRSDLLWIYDLKKNVAPDFPQERMAPVGFTPGGVLVVRTPGRPLRFLDPKTFKIITPPLTDAQRGGGKPAGTQDEPVTKTEPEPERPEFRTWTSANGKYTVEAALVRAEKDIVHLKRKDGRVIRVPLTKLSAADRKFLSERND